LATNLAQTTSISISPVTTPVPDIYYERISEEISSTQTARNPLAIVRSIPTTTATTDGGGK